MSSKEKATGYLSNLKDMDENFASYMIIGFTLILLVLAIWYIIYLTKLNNSNTNYMNDLYPSVDGNIRPISANATDSSGCLYDYYIKTAYNACSGGSYKNDFDNICNLKCVTCTPNNSTQILAERFKFDEKVDAEYTRKYITEVVAKQAPKKIDFIKTTLANATFNRLRFDILGGEPLINPAIFEFMDWLSEQSYAKQTTVALTTNGTTYTDKLTKYLDKFL